MPNRAARRSAADANRRYVERLSRGASESIPLAWPNTFLYKHEVCGGDVDIDRNHRVLGGYCASCDYLVSNRDIRRKTREELEAGQETLVGGS